MLLRFLARESDLMIYCRIESNRLSPASVPANSAARLWLPQRWSLNCFPIEMMFPSLEAGRFPVLAV
jgi:hypothetical protein